MTGMSEHVAGCKSWGCDPACPLWSRDTGDWPGLVGVLWRLYDAIWYSPADVVKNLPQPILDAYGEVQRYHRATIADEISSLADGDL